MGSCYSTAAQTPPTMGKGKGQNEGGFSEEQIQMNKERKKKKNKNKDGKLDKNDLRDAFDNVGVLMSESELDGLLGEISGPCTYDNKGKIDSKMFEHALKTWGDKMTKAEIDDIFGELDRRGLHDQVQGRHRPVRLRQGGAQG